jgi:hypothetical protein
MIIPKNAIDGNVTVDLTRDELWLLRDMIGNTHSGDDDWRVNPDDFENTIGISYARAHQIASIMEQLQEKKMPIISLTLTKKNGEP